MSSLSTESGGVLPKGLLKEYSTDSVTLPYEYDEMTRDVVRYNAHVVHNNRSTVSRQDPVACQYGYLPNDPRDVHWVVEKQRKKPSCHHSITWLYELRLSGSCVPVIKLGYVV